MIKKIIILVGLLCMAFIASSQEYPIYNQYHFHNYLMNPASAGVAECSHFLLSHKQQWIGIKDAPHTQILSFQTRTKIGLGFGGYLYNDKNGYSYQQGGQATVAYHIPMTPGNRYSRSRSLDRQLSFGLSAKFYRYDFDYESLMEYANATGDNIDMKRGIYPNVNFGVYFQSYNFFTGLSLTNLMPIKLDMFGDGEPMRPFTAFYQIGYAFEPKRDFELEPSAVFKIDETGRSQLDLNFRVTQHLRNDISWWAGFSFKQTFDDKYKTMLLLPNINILLGKFRIGYALGIDLNKIARHNYGSHEIMIGYSFCYSRKFCKL